MRRCAAWLTDPVRATSKKYRSGKLNSEKCMEILLPEKAMLCQFSINQNAETASILRISRLNWPRARAE